MALPAAPLLKSSFLLLILSLALTLASPVEAEPGKKHLVVYAQFQQDTMVDLSDGSRWAMDKGDCFPIYMFKEHQTKVILQLGPATFWTDATRVRVMRETEAAQAQSSYQKNLDNFTKLREKQAKGDSSPAQ